MYSAVFWLLAKGNCRLLHASFVSTQQPFSQLLEWWRQCSWGLSCKGSGNSIIGFYSFFLPHRQKERKHQSCSANNQQEKGKLERPNAELFNKNSLTHFSFSSITLAARRRVKRWSRRSQGDSCRKCMECMIQLTICSAVKFLLAEFAHTWCPNNF